ncbi:hypothetical protein GCM10007981_02230 [Thermocladium modestius]|uniref:Uncharacterized protein n=1 Tax=Thermocladium modestius TaxID=62609 RepID=A0A830GVS0_9CREN|nr:hypothetical protein [Thermocladium modestius]GGP19261.1 hypothetical protein GCM10007981_02230 [Thermocladium modestius]
MSLDVAIITAKRYPICKRVPCLESSEPHDVIIDMTGKNPGLGLVTVINRGSDAAPLIIDGVPLKSIICTVKDKCIEWVGDRLIVNGVPLTIYLSALFDELLAELSELMNARVREAGDKRVKYCVDKLVGIVVGERRRGASVTLMGLESLLKSKSLVEVDLPSPTLQVLREAGVVDGESLIDSGLLHAILREVRRRVYP